MIGKNASLNSFSLNSALITDVLEEFLIKRYLVRYP